MSGRLPCPVHQRYPNIIDVVREEEIIHPSDNDQDETQFGDHEENDQPPNLVPPTLREILNISGEKICQLVGTMPKGDRMMGKEVHFLIKNAGIELTCRCLGLPPIRPRITMMYSEIVGEIFSFFGISCERQILLIIIMSWQGPEKMLDAMISKK